MKLRNDAAKNGNNNNNNGNKEDEPGDLRNESTFVNMARIA